MDVAVPGVSWGVAASAYSDRSTAWYGPAAQGGVGTVAASLEVARTPEEGLVAQHVGGQGLDGVNDRPETLGPADDGPGEMLDRPVDLYDKGIQFP